MYCTQDKNGQQISGHSWSSPTAQPLLFCLLAMPAGWGLGTRLHHLQLITSLSLASHTLHSPARNVQLRVAALRTWRVSNKRTRSYEAIALDDAPSLDNVTYQGSRVRARENAGKHVFSRKAESRRGRDGRQLTHAVGQNRFSGDPLLVSPRASCTQVSREGVEVDLGGSCNAATTKLW